MVDTATADLRSERQAQIKRLAEADFDDEVLIAEARKRTKLREVERELLKDALKAPYEDHSHDQEAQEPVVQKDLKQEQDTTQEMVDIGGVQPDFGSLFEQFRNACDHMDPEDALDCPGCGEYPPDDPIMTSCLCVYCTECFTELLAKANKAGGSSSMPCSAYEDERITDYKTLTAGQFEALVSIFNHHTRTDQSSKMPYPKETQLLPDDVEVLWRSGGTGNVSAYGSGDHSRSSPELGDDSMELSSDGFDRESRSIGYESDSSCESASQLGLISASVCLVDPRHAVDDVDVPCSDDENQSCLRVTSSELRELGVDMHSWGGPPQNVTTPAPDASVPALHIDLTRSDDAQHRAMSPSEDAREVSSDRDGIVEDDENEQGDIEDEEDGDPDEEDLCKCRVCTSAPTPESSSSS